MNLFDRGKNVNQNIVEAVAACRDALSEPEWSSLSRCLPDAPGNAEGWFELLSGFPDRPANVAAFNRMREAVDAIAAVDRRPEFERYAVLQSFTMALPRVSALPVALSVKREFAETAFRAARPNGQWRRNFAAARPPFMVPMARLATLREFPAGELSFNFHGRMSIAWPMRFPPLAVPGFFYEMMFGMKGWGPFISPHINRWRPNPLILHREEAERSLWRMAKTLEQRPDVKFLMSDSWLNSAETARTSPHLAWMRAFFTEGGAYVVDMEAADKDSGFRDDNKRRNALYAAGCFHPRRTLALWARDDMLAWAALRLDLIDEDESACAARARRPRRFRVGSPKPARAAKHNSIFHLWNGMGLLSQNPIKYALLILIAPAVIAGIAASFIAWWCGPPVFLAAFIFAWVFQYYAFQ